MKVYAVVRNEKAAFEEVTLRLYTERVDAILHARASARMHARLYGTTQQPVIEENTSKSFSASTGGVKYTVVPMTVH